MDREKLIKHFEHLLNAAKGNYQDFVDLTVDGGEEILALLKEQSETIKELQNAYDYLQKQFFEAQDKLLKEQEAVEPIPPTDESDMWRCGNCKHQIFRCKHQRFCEKCGKAVKWK